MIDLGFINEEQLWEVLEEAQSTGVLTGQVALERGLVTEEQVLQAVAEQRGLKVVNLEETRPQPEAITMVPETMAALYKIVPLSIKDNVLLDGKIDAAEARWLRKMLFADGIIDADEKKFLKDLKREANATSPAFDALYNECLGG